MRKPKSLRKDFEPGTLSDQLDTGPEKKLREESKRIEASLRKERKSALPKKIYESLSDRERRVVDTVLLFPEPVKKEALSIIRQWKKEGLVLDKAVDYPDSNAYDLSCRSKDPQHDLVILYENGIVSTHTSKEFGDEGED